MHLGSWIGVGGIRGQIGERCAVSHSLRSGGSGRPAQRTTGSYMRLRRGITVAVVAAGGAVTTMLVGLVTNAVSESEWPGWLGWLQRHAWFSFALLGGAMVGLTVLLAALSDP